MLAIAWGLSVLLACQLVAWSDPTTAEQARAAVGRWLAADGRPLGSALGREVGEVRQYNDAKGSPVYFVVCLKPSGFVIVSGDDLVEPIIGFAANGRYDPSPSDPLAALVERDLPGRVGRARAGLGAAPAALRAKWHGASPLGDDPPPMGRSGSVSDERVPPLVQSRWSQSNAGGSYCYNYYTPNHYVCGCVATAMSQLMRFHQHPTSPVGTRSFTVYVDGDSETRTTRGGDGSGGAYAWSQMPLVPGSSLTEAQRQAVGALCYDAGLSVNMMYSGSGSGAYTIGGGALKSTFGYGNAIEGGNWGNIGAGLTAMVNPNLDSGRPVLLGIFGSGGHAIVCDGYGYNQSTLYHHLNLGWAGSYDAWYNLPNIDAGYEFTSVGLCTYNVFKTGSGEIISGRVLDSAGQPLAGASITAIRSGGGTYTATTNSRGIFALAKAPSNSSYTITCSAAGETYAAKTVSTGRSVAGATTSGNVWGVNFGNEAPPVEVTTTSLPAGRVGAAYAAALAATGGTSPYQWTCVPAEVLSAAQAPAAGTAQGWRADDRSWSLPLPFAFPYGGETYTAVYVCSNGYLDFENSYADYSDSTAELQSNVRIAPLWDDLRTDGAGQDIYVSQPTAQSIAIRWVGQDYWGSNAVDFEVVLSSSGDIVLHYGDGNTGLSPTVGISAGDEAGCVLSAHNGQSNLACAQTATFQPLHPGLNLNATTGQIAGTPTAGGARQLRFTVEGTSGGTANRTLELDVAQDAPPVVEDVRFQPALESGGGAFQVLAEVTDDSAVAEVWCVLTVEGQDPVELPLAAAAADTWETASRAYAANAGAAGIAFSAVVHARDGAGQLVSSDACVAEQPPDLAPVVQDVRFEPALRPGGGTFQVLAEVTDDVAVAEAWCVLTIGGEEPVDVAMTAGATPDTWETAPRAYPLNCGAASIAFSAVVHARDGAGQAVCSDECVAEQQACLAPIADAGEDETAEVGDTVALDGVGSRAAEEANVALAAAGAAVTGTNGRAWDALIDGNTTDYSGGSGFGYTYWVTSPPGSMTVTLAETYSIGRIRVKLWDGDSRSYRYRVETATDLAGPWHTVVDRTRGTHRGWCDDRFAAVDAKYVRLTGTYNSRNWGFHVVELEAYATDPLTYAWTQVDGPSVSLSDATAMAPTFAPTEPDLYVFELVVDDGIQASAPDRVEVTVVLPPPPVADAGEDQAREVGDTVTLDGSGSRPGRETNVALASAGATIAGTNGGAWDALIDGDSTAYTGRSGYGYTYWATSPPGSMTVTLAETYGIGRVRVKLWDRDGRSYRYRVATATDPAGPWHTVVDRTSGSHRGWCDNRFAPVDARYIRLTGTYNSRNWGFHVVELEAYTTRPLTYAWTQVDGPTVSLSDATAMAPTFAPAEPTDYAFELVVHDGIQPSTPDRVAVAVTMPPPPLADAGEDQGLEVGDTAVLDGSGSRPGRETNVALAAAGATITGTNGGAWGALIDGDSTDYTGGTGYGYTYWTTGPAGSMTVALAQTYSIGRIRLKLWDGDSRSYRYRVEAASALGGPWQTVVDRTSGSHRGWCDGRFAPVEAKYIRLTGTYNSRNAGFHVVELEAYATSPLAYAWSQVDGPAIALGAPGDVTRVFTPAEPGLYAFELVVDDGIQASAPDRVDVTVSLPPPPVADAGADQTAEVGDTVSLDGSGSRAADETNVALAAAGATITGTNGAAWDALIDGNSTEYTGGAGYAYTWWTTQPPGSMTIALAQAYSIGLIRVKLWDGDSRCYRYRVEAAAEAGGPWQTVVDRTSGDHRGWCEDRFAPVVARHLRITGTHNSRNAGFHVVELEAFAAEPLAYAWSQVAGPAVTLSDASAVRPTFAPAEPGQYGFELVVDDGVQASAADRVDVSVAALAAPLPPPADVAASDGLFEDFVEVTWTHAADAAAYEVCRSVQDEPGAALRVATVMGGTRFVDVDVLPDQAYFYWVRSVDGERASRLSAGDSGFAGVPPDPEADEVVDESKDSPNSF